MIRGIKVKKLYDGIHMEPLEDVTVLFDETGFTDIIMSDKTGITGGDQINIEDKSDLYMMPGLVDCHVHLMLPGDGTKGEYIMRDWSQGEVAVMAYRNAMTALAAGVTTLRDCGGAYNCAVTVKNTFERRASKFDINMIFSNFDLIKNSERLKTNFNRYKLKKIYVKDISYEDVMNSIEIIIKLIQKELTPVS